MSQIDAGAARERTLAEMSCADCVLGIREEVFDVAGVDALEIGPGSGRLTVSGEGYSSGGVRAVVAVAGYEGV